MNSRQTATNIHELGLDQLTGFQKQCIDQRNKDTELDSNKCQICGKIKTCTTNSPHTVCCDCVELMQRRDLELDLLELSKMPLEQRISNLERTLLESAFNMERGTCDAIYAHVCQFCA